MFGINNNQQYIPGFTQPGFNTYAAPFAPYAPYAPYGMTGFQQPYAGIPAYNGNELNLVLNRVEEIRHQVALLCESMKLSQANHGLHQGLHGQIFNGQINPANWTGLGFGLNGVNTFNGLNTLENTSPIRLRESDSHIFMDVYLPQLTMGDVDVEVSGNRIVCRTRVPVGPISRLWANAQIPRGFELYELADGRVEFSWIAPVTFQAKEVEATWREGFLCVCIPKQEVTPRHNVKVVRETVSNRKSDAMNS